MPGWAWWQRFGYEFYELKKVAIRVLAQVTGSTASERAWSAMGFVHDKKQNHLDAQHAIDLTYIYHSLRVRDSITPS